MAAVVGASLMVREISVTVTAARALSSCCSLAVFWKTQPYEEGRTVESLPAPCAVKMEVLELTTKARTMLSSGQCWEASQLPLH